MSDAQKIEQPWMFIAARNMMMLDWFAGQALVSMSAKDLEPEEVARRCYEIAIAMVEYGSGMEAEE